MKADLSPQKLFRLIPLFSKKLKFSTQLYHPYGCYYKEAYIGLLITVPLWKLMLQCQPEYFLLRLGIPSGSQENQEVYPVIINFLFYFDNMS